MESTSRAEKLRKLLYSPVMAAPGPFKGGTQVEFVRRKSSKPWMIEERERS